MGSRYHVKIAGQGFLLRPGSYRRRSVAVGTGAAEPPSPTGLGLGWRQWSQSDWRGGDGQDTGGQGAGGSLQTPRRFRTGYGIDVGEAGRVRLGPALTGSFSSEESGFAAMLAFGSRLYAAAGSSGKLYRYDGVTWEVAHDTLKPSLRSLARYGGGLYLGSGSDGLVKSFDGESWADTFNVAGASAVAAMAGYGVWDATAKATVPRLFVAAEYPSGEAKIHRWDGSTLVEVAGCQEARVEAMAVYGGRLFVATSEGSGGSSGAVQGRILSFDGRSASGEWEEVVWFSDNYVAGWAVFDNLLFCGSGTGGKVWAFDGSRMSEVYCLSSRGLEYVEPMRALAVRSGRLYAGYSHPTQGTALLCKLAPIPQPLPPDPCLGWHTPATAGAGGNVGAMAVYGGCLYLASEAPGAAIIYRMEAGVYRSSGLLETSFFDGGMPGVAKRLRSLTLSHEKLRAGDYLEASFALEGSDTFQRVESFGDLAGCDRDLTTADWRTGSGGLGGTIPEQPMLRLKGMPAQGFAGKQPGNTSVPHSARKLVSTNHNSPPPAFTEEFTEEEYGAISVAGGEVATVSSSIEGGYAHQLFEFDLAGLSLAGIRPRAVAYGRGDDGGAPAPGILFRIWNHATGVWDLVGSNSAGPEEGAAARTMEVTLSEGFGAYVGATGRVYLSLRSSYRGSAANPAEVGADLVEMGALWAGSGEGVSEPLRLPSSEAVSGATLSLLSSTVPAGTSIELFMSADGGVHWESVSSGVEHSFAYPGSSLRWKARLSSVDGLNTPWIERLKVDYLAGSWLPLGRSEVEGSTSATFTFQEGVNALRVAFRIELGSSDSLDSPALAGITLQYALQPEVKRQWEMELRCEGAAGVPLRLPDGSVESKTGRELSRVLWQARSQSVTSFEDVDGSLCQVWFEGLEERLSEAAQDRGPQTTALCRLTEC